MHVRTLSDEVTADPIRTRVWSRGEEDGMTQVWADTMVSVTLAAEPAVCCLRPLGKGEAHVMKPGMEGSQIEQGKSCHAPPLPPFSFFFFFKGP